MDATRIQVTEFDELLQQGRDDLARRHAEARAAGEQTMALKSKDHANALKLFQQTTGISRETMVLLQARYDDGGDDLWPGVVITAFGQSTYVEIIPEQQLRWSSWSQLSDDRQRLSAFLAWAEEKSQEEDRNLQDRIAAINAAGEIQSRYFYPFIWYEVVYAVVANPSDPDQRLVELHWLPSLSPQPEMEHGLLWWTDARTGDRICIINQVSIIEHQVYLPSQAPKWCRQPITEAGGKLMVVTPAGAEALPPF